jgi:hypothetical protein
LMTTLQNTFALVVTLVSCLILIRISISTINFYLMATLKFDRYLFFAFAHLTRFIAFQIALMTTSKFFLTFSLTLTDLFDLVTLYYRCMFTYWKSDFKFSLAC